MSQLYVGNIDLNTTIQDLVREFEPYGEIRSCKIPQILSNRKYAFVEFKRRSDALIAIQSWNGKFNWRVNFSYHSQAAHAAESDGSNSNVPISFFICGGFGHFVNDCRFAQSNVSNFAVVSMGGGSGTGVYLPSNCDFGGGFGDFLRNMDIKNKGVEQFQGIRLEKNNDASSSKWELVRSPPPPPPRWLDLPEDITAKILYSLGPIGLLYSAQYVCTTWRKICRDPTMWRVIDMWKLDDDVDIYDFPYECIKLLCCRAVDLSQGQVTEVNIEKFGSDYLLEYIAGRCGNLRCLRLAFCNDISDRSLREAVKKFPLLEVLHLQCTPAEKGTIEAIGQSCPVLKTFALNGTDGMEFSDEAVAIATVMPGLRHLQLFGNEMSNEVLDAILNGCPLLESLDLRRCFNLDLDGELGKRCAQQIKIFRRPFDPTDDYEWVDWETDMEFDYDYEFDDLHDIVSDLDFYEDYDYGHDWDPYDHFFNNPFG